MISISNADLIKIISYLEDATKLYNALPMQKCKCRAHMITQLLTKLKTKQNGNKTNTR
jgi:hypothetical protein